MEPAGELENDPIQKAGFVLGKGDGIGGVELNLNEAEQLFEQLGTGGLMDGYVLASVSFMAKVRPYGPTQAQIDTAVNAATLGHGFHGDDLVLTGPNAKTITLKNVGIGTDIPGMISDALSGSGFLTGNQTITLSGDATGSGATAIEVTVTNIHPPVSGSVGQVLTRTTTGVGYSNAPTTLANSPRALSWSTNLLYVAAGTTNVLGWITNYAGSSVVGTNCATNLTAGGLYILGNPSILGSTDGTNWWEASQFATNAAIKIAVSAEPSSAGRNPPVPVPVDAWLTNLTLYALSLPGTFGQTNSLFGQHLYVSDPISGTEAASKQYVDQLFGFTDWWSAANDVQLNGNSLNWNNDWSSRTNYPSTNSAILQFKYYGQNRMALR